METLKLSTALALLILVDAGRADPLGTWTWRNPWPTGNHLNAVTYGNDLFVAVGDVGTIVTSADGTNWVLRQSATTDRLSDIAYGNGQFVAVGRNMHSQDGPGTIVISADGVNWVPHSAGPGYLFDQIAYGNGQFVASAYTSVSPAFLVTSRDGVNWSSATGPGWFWLNDAAITYGNSQFVAVGFSHRSRPGSIIVTSAEGTNWVQRLEDTTNRLSGIAYGNGQFVAVGDGAVLTSTDAINWAKQPQSATGSLTYGNGLFVAVDALGTITTSADGTNWTQRPSWPQGISFDLSRVAYGNGRFVAVGSTIETSTDGVNWIDRANTRVGDADDLLLGIAYGNGRFVAVGSATYYSRGPGIVVSSADGTNWIQRQLGTVPALYGIAYGNRQFVAVGEAGTILTSADGVNWIRRQPGIPYTLNGVAYGNGQFVAVSAAIADIISSVDGVNWVRRHWDRESLATYPVNLAGIGYGNGQFVAVGGGYFTKMSDRPSFLIERIILTSTDGVNWAVQHSPSLCYLNRVTYGKGEFVAVGCGPAGVASPPYVSIVVTSSDGLNWIQRRSETNHCITDIAYGSGQFVAVGHNDDNDSFRYSFTFSTFLTSNDGANWVRRQANWKHPLSAVAYGNGHFVGVGPGGTILQSGSLITLTITPNIASGLLSLSLVGPTGLDYAIQTSSDLVSWHEVTKVSNAPSTRVILDGLPAASDRVFYRASSEWGHNK